MCVGGRELCSCPESLKSGVPVRRRRREEKALHHGRGTYSSSSCDARLRFSLLGTKHQTRKGKKRREETSEENLLFSHKAFFHYSQLGLEPHEWTH